MGFFDKVNEYAEKTARKMDRVAASELEKSYRKTGSYDDLNPGQWQRELNKQEWATNWLEKRGKL